MKYGELTIDDCELHEWHERDRDCVELRHIETQSTLVIYWDEDFREAIKDGFLKPGHFKQNLWDYLQETLLHYGDYNEEITEDYEYLHKEHPMRDLIEKDDDDA